MKIRSSFLLFEAKVILNINLSSRSRLDDVLWHYDKLGLYSVKSGYWLSRSSLQVPSSSGSSDTSEWWWFLWQLNSPSKIKNFLWRVFHNWIPSLSMLVDKRVVDSVRCPLCSKQDETIVHAIWGCKALSSIPTDCASMPFPPSFDSMSAQDFLFGYKLLNFVSPFELLASLVKKE
ncbi:hypothetical protein ACOSQ2_014521 [Xanthoceras sorbifolium]